MKWHAVSGILAKCQRDSIEWIQTSNFLMGIAMSCCFDVCDVLQSIYVHQKVNETKPASANPNFGLQK